MAFAEWNDAVWENCLTFYANSSDTDWNTTQDWWDTCGPDNDFDPLDFDDWLAGEEFISLNDFFSCVVNDDDWQWLGVYGLVTAVFPCGNTGLGDDGAVCGSDATQQTRVDCCNRYAAIYNPDYGLGLESTSDIGLEFSLDALLGSFTIREMLDTLYNCEESLCAGNGNYWGPSTEDDNLWNPGTWAYGTPYDDNCVGWDRYDCATRGAQWTKNGDAATTDDGTSPCADDMSDCCVEQELTVTSVATQTCGDFDGAAYGNADYLQDITTDITYSSTNSATNGSAIYGTGTSYDSAGDCYWKECGDDSDCASYNVCGPEGKCQIACINDSGDFDDDMCDFGSVCTDTDVGEPQGAPGGCVCEECEWDSLYDCYAAVFAARPVTNDDEALADLAICNGEFYTPDADEYNLMLCNLEMGQCGDAFEYCIDYLVENDPENICDWFDKCAGGSSGRIDSDYWDTIPTDKCGQLYYDDCRYTLGFDCWSLDWDYNEETGLVECTDIDQERFTSGDNTYYTIETALQYAVDAAEAAGIDWTCSDEDRPACPEGAEYEGTVAWIGGIYVDGRSCVCQSPWTGDGTSCVYPGAPQGSSRATDEGSALLMAFDSIYNHTEIDTGGLEFLSWSDANSFCVSSTTIEWTNAACGNVGDNTGDWPAETITIANETFTLDDSTDVTWWFPLRDTSEGGEGIAVVGAAPIHADWDCTDGSCSDYSSTLATRGYYQDYLNGMTRYRNSEGLGYGRGIFDEDFHIKWGFDASEDSMGLDAGTNNIEALVSSIIDTAIQGMSTTLVENIDGGAFTKAEQTFKNVPRKTTTLSTKPLSVFDTGDVEAAQTKTTQVSTTATTTTTTSTSDGGTSY